MFEFLEKHDLAIRSLCISRVLKSIKIFFESVRLVRLAVHHLPYNPIRSATYLLRYFESFAYVRFYFLVVSHVFIN